MINNEPIWFPKDAYHSFISERISEIKKECISNSSTSSIYEQATHDREIAINQILPEFSKSLNALIDAMEVQSYELQIACYQQGLIDGQITLAQIVQASA